MKLLLTIAALAGAAPMGVSNAEPLRDGAWLQAEIARAKAGAVIVVPDGDYDLTDVKVPRSLTLRAAGRAVLRSASVTDKGILVPQPGVDLTVENLTFEGARAWDKNGAGIRHEGRNLTIINCRFIANEDGVLATGDPAGVISIQGSAFIGSGFGDGQSHGVYVSSGARVEVEDTHFAATRIGHHLKSLADATLVRRSTFDDQHGRSSYAIDASKGGALTVEDSRFIQSADSDNQAIINYDLSRGGAAAAIRIINPRIVNAYDGGVFLRNDTKSAPVIAGAAIENRARRPLRMVSPGSPAPRER